MLNSRLFYILLANIVVLSANLWFFSDQQSTSASQEGAPSFLQLVKNRVKQQPLNDKGLLLKEEHQNLAPNLSQSVSTDSGDGSLQTSAAAATISPAQKIQQNLDKAQQQTARDQQRLARQKQQLASLQRENARLLDHVSTLENQVHIKQAHIEEAETRELQLNEQLQVARNKQNNAVNDPIKNIKTAIDQQPDLIKPANKGGVVLSEEDGVGAEVVDENGLVIQPVDDDVIALTEAEEVQPFSGAIEFGFNYEQDNQETKGLHGRLLLDYDVVDKYNLNSDLEFEFETEDKVSSTEKYRWQLQADYHLDPSNIVFVRSDLQRSKYASYEREDTFTTGYGRIFFNENNHKLNTEIGPGYKFAQPNAGEDEVSYNEFIVRTRVNYERVLSETLQFAVEGVVELGKANSIFSTEFRSQKRIYQQLYLVFSLNYKYNQNVPVDTEHDEVSAGFKVMYAF
nr:hypothetical protein BCCFPMHH_00023 [uncultured bacterium]